MTGPLDAPDKPSGLHPVNIGHLVMGVAFAGMVLVWALVQGDVVDTSELRWLLPIPWLAAGAAGLAATVWPGRRQQLGRASRASRPAARTTGGRRSRPPRWAVSDQSGGDAAAMIARPSSRCSPSTETGAVVVCRGRSSSRRRRR